MTFTQRGELEPSSTCTPHCEHTPTPPHPAQPTSTHLGVLDPNGARRQCLCHHLALGSDNCDRLIDCTPWKGLEKLNHPKPQQ